MNRWKLRLKKVRSVWKFSHTNAYYKITPLQIENVSIILMAHTVNTKDSFREFHIYRLRRCKYFLT